MAAILAGLLAIGCSAADPTVDPKRALDRAATAAAKATASTATAAAKDNAHTATAAAKATASTATAAAEDTARTAVAGAKATVRVTLEAADAERATAAVRASQHRATADIARALGGSSGRATASAASRAALEEDRKAYTGNPPEAVATVAAVWATESALRPTPRARPPTPRAPSGALEQAIRNNGDFSARPWSSADCEDLAAVRRLGHEWGFVDTDGKVKVTPYQSDIPARAPFTGLSSEWLRHCF